MKKFYVMIACSLLIFSCSIGSEDNERLFENSEEVIGKWNYIERTFSIGTSEQIREKIESDKITIEFLPDGEVVSVNFFECDQASYQIEGDVLRIDFACEAERGDWEYRLSWEGENLILNQISPSQCLEGCGHIFRKASLTTKGKF